MASCFSEALYAWERDLFGECFLGRFLRLSPRAARELLDELAAVSQRLLGVRHVLVHRDMQASNVIIHKGKPVFIDFQGMRLGPAAYDVAALLCDPYVMLSSGSRARLLDYYLSRCRRPDSVASVFRFAAIQRLAQALGAFGRLSSCRGTERFARYVDPALLMLRQVLEHADGLPALAELTEAAGRR
jgi:aminoglycoside/choline kinase family phosphotransferase